jgi:hypothetical protein
MKNGDGALFRGIRRRRRETDGAEAPIENFTLAARHCRGDFGEMKIR